MSETSGKRAKQTQETREKLLQAALNAFADHGYEAASIREIAAEAGVKHGLIRYHFQDKERLFKSAVDFLFERLERDMRAPPEEENYSTYEKLRAWIRRYVRYCARHPEHGRIMIRESLQDSERLKWAVETHIIKNHEGFRKQVPARVGDGIFPDISHHSLVYIITAAAQSIFMLGSEVNHVYGIDVFNEEAIDAHAEAMLNLFFEHRVSTEVQ